MNVKNRTGKMIGWIFPAAVAFLALSLTACVEDVPSDTDPDPDPQTMQFKSGARYEFNTYNTDPEDGGKVSATERTRIWTLVNTNATVAGKSGVALYVDSIFSLGGIAELTDTVALKQESSNNVFRYALIVPELDLSAAGVAGLEFSEEWMHEAKLGATSAKWFVADVSDTFEFETGIPNVRQFVLKLTDSAVGSAKETLTIGGSQYESTKTTHKLELSLSALVEIGPAVVPVKVKSVSLDRKSWMVPSLGVIAKEERSGTVIEAEYQGQGLPPIPVPGYVSVMTKVLATGN